MPGPCPYPSPPTSQQSLAHLTPSFHPLPLWCLPACHTTATQLRAPAALLSHISRIRRDGVLVIECIGQWRRTLVASDPEGMSLVAAGEGSTSAAAAAAFRPFLWRGQDYLAKMLHDADFLAELGVAPRMLELGAEALRYNPLFAPTTLSNAVRMPPLPSVASHLIDRCASAPHAPSAAPSAPRAQPGRLLCRLALPHITPPTHTHSSAALPLQRHLLGAH